MGVEYELEDHLNLAEYFPVGGYIQDELDARGWSPWEYKEFAQSAGKNLCWVKKIMSGVHRLSEEDAIAISNAFGTSHELWLGLDEDYWEYKVRSQDPSGGLASDRSEMLYA